MKSIPLLNQKVERVGVANISQDGFEAPYDVLKALETTAVSVGYRIDNPEDYHLTSGDANPVKDCGERRFFVVQEVRPHKFVPSNPRNLCNVCGVLHHNHEQEVK